MIIKNYCDIFNLDSESIRIAITYYTFLIFGEFVLVA